MLGQTGKQDRFSRRCPRVTQQAFVIDQGRCIGCHACTVACKVEHGVELGVFRTWVKYIERGDFPDVRRHFAVLRCNHCTDAPCVQVCPVTALYKREDGIVDFDPQRCIGCKACLNACPYDALYIDPNSNTAAKCNFCAHRVELELKPSCEVVCPVGAIISGDIDDPDSEVSRLLGTAPSTVRSAEQGTGPNVYYLGADSAGLDPLAAGGGEAYLTSEVRPAQREKLTVLNGDARAVVTMDVDHPPPWGWKVSSYFLSKGVAAGAMMLAPLLLVLGPRGSALADIAPGVLALVGIAITGLLLIWDLKQPQRAYLLFTAPQWRSWLARGAQAINLAAVLAFAFTLAAVLGWHGLRDGLRWALVPAGALLAGYTAFLFNQCEGRDLWQSPLLLPHTIVNALVAGAGALGITAIAVDAQAALLRALGWAVVLGVGLSAALIALDTFGHHPTRQAERAASNLYRDRFARRFWLGGVLVGLAAPALLGAAFLAADGVGLLAGAGGCALVGLWFYEDAWVRAGQSVPLS
jgi:Fe-S-cluster-containing dehydrogenase component/formate-dependent nitrite reductase membrane component NrfD